MLTVPEDTVIFTGVTELDKGKTLLFAALGLCLGAIDVSVGPTESVILMKKRNKVKTGNLNDVLNLNYLKVTHKL